MFALYKRTRLGTNATRYELKELKKKKEISLFGCKNGLIPLLLGFKLPPGQGEPCKWHVDVVGELGRHPDPDYLDCTILIDLKPKQNKTNLSLYEVMDVWGYSDGGWTPILLRLNALFIDEDPSLVNRNDFTRMDNDVDGPIYEFLYLKGSVTRGKITGSWTLPRASSTNAVLLWPETLNYIIQSIRSRTPDVLNV